MSTPIDVTTTDAWRRLATHADELRPDLRTWFDQDPGRAERLSHTMGELYVDLSKNLITDETLSLLTQVAEQVDLPGRIAAMFAGERINATEDRAVLHTALRRP